MREFGKKPQTRIEMTCHVAASQVSFERFAVTYSSDSATAPEPTPHVHAHHTHLTALDKLDAEFGAAIDSREASMREAFLALDSDRSGFISFAQLGNALTRFGLKCTPDQTKALCELYDLDHSGKISYAEFVERAKKRTRRYSAHLDRQQDDLSKP